ncbi:hypothetical protein ABE237_00665 [Brevibacillus formosus]|uniref:hypothetical protein n=1 Tax=Brevibacillus formosus TaxID=54913 RepID=UPI0018CC9FDE|nr:hypothetical protein [Brevibacillus formosus]MBG9944662.1 hypothetical protein [Brevibacillus formosus]
MKIKTYRVEMKDNLVFSWLGFLDCCRYCMGTLKSVHLHSGFSLENINEKIECNSQYEMTDDCWNAIAKKVDTRKFNQIVEALRSYSDRGYVVIEAHLPPLSKERWDSFNFKLTEVV